MASLSLTVGIALEYKPRAAQLYDIAFGEKLAVAIPNAEERLKIITASMQLQYSIGAFDNNRLVGLAGFSTLDGSLTGGINYSGLLSGLGWLNGNRAAAVLSLYERKAKAGELLMDGIVVDADFRGQKIGTQLFEKLIKFAQENQYKSIRLDVIDTNDGARRLYERLGFTVVTTEKFEFLRGILGFGASSTMIYRL